MKNVIKRVKSVKLQCVKVSKCGVFSGPYFPEFGLNTERYEVSSVRMRENTDQKKTPYLDTFQLVLLTTKLLNQLKKLEH